MDKMLDGVKKEILNLLEKEEPKSIAHLVHLTLISMEENQYQGLSELIESYNAALERTKKISSD